MKRTSYLSIGIAILCIAMGLSSCDLKNTIHGEGEVTSYTRSLTDFTSLDISAPAKATIVLDNSAEPTIVIKTYPNIADHILSQVSGNRLIVKSDANLSMNKDLVIEIHAKSLHALSLTGAVGATLKGAVDANSFDIDLTGASELVVEQLNTQKLNVDMTGASELKVKAGNVDHANYEVTGAGDVEAYSLLCNNADADITGAGDMQINVVQNLNAQISGAGNISYKGSPKVKSDVSGVGDIHSVN